MTTVKYAVSAYTADGTTTDYLITWDYLDEDHIAVYVDGTSNADPTANHTFTKLNNTTLRITDGIGGAVVSGADIEIRRETPLLTRAITFADGSALLAEDLNKNSDYLLYSMQEVLDTVDAAAQDGALAAEVATEALRDETEGFRDTTLTARNTTQGYLATVQSDATDADNHRIAAAASETAAAASEAASAASEAAGAASEAAAAASETAAATSETNAAASEAASAASEAAAAASETTAAASQVAAASSEANAETAWDSLDDRYLGAKAAAPTLDNDGDALQTGALYWNSTSDEMYVWNGSAWDTFNSTIGIADGATSTAVTIDPSGNVGVNTASPTSKLHVLGDGSVPIRWGDTTSLGTLTYSGNDPIVQSNTGNMLFYSGSNETLRIDLAGNVTSPARISNGTIGDFHNRLVYTISNNGAFTYTSADYFSWDQRFIGIMAGKASNTAPEGYFDIEMPPVGTVINGLGTNPDVTVTSSGVPLSEWSALYYELPIGSIPDTVNGNFYWGYYNKTNSSDIGENFILVAVVNGDNPHGGDTLYTCARGRRGIPKGSKDWPDTKLLTPSLSGGWVGYGSTYGSPSYSRKNNLVTLTGLIKGGSGGATLFTFPSGFRPKDRVLHDSIGNGVIARFDIEQNGNLAVHSVNFSSSWMNVNVTFTAYS